MVGTYCRVPTAIALAFLAAALPAFAEEPDARALLQRLDKLEKQNETLQKSVLEQRELLRQQQEALQRRDRVPEAALPDADAVKKIVDGYLQGRDEARQVGTNVETSPSGDAGADRKFSASWKDGFQAETADKAFKFHVGGRVDLDAAFYRDSRALSRSIGAFNNFVDPNNGGGGAGLNDGAELRRARIRMDGTFYDRLEYVFETDLSSVIDERRRTLGSPTAAGQAPAAPTVAGTPFEFEPTNGVRFTDVYLGFRDLPYVGTFRAGHQKEELTFANSTSSRFLTFIERPLIFDAFNDDYQYALGLALNENLFDERASVWLGVFRNTNPFTNDNRNGGFDTGDGQYAYDARLTALPVWMDDGDYWAHLGADYSYRNLHDDVTRFRALPQVRSGAGFEIPNLINTGAIFSKDAQQNFTIECASALGPLTLTAEYAGAVVGNAFTGGLPLPNGKLPAGVKSRGDYVAQGYYVEMLYFLTPDHRGYDRVDRHAYARVRPRHNFSYGDSNCGCGAWEVGVRYDYVDLSNRGINGGLLHALTAGVNWHLNPNAKLQWNYVWMERNFTPPNAGERVAGDLNGFGMRFHWDY